MKYKDFGKLIGLSEGSVKQLMTRGQFTLDRVEIIARLHERLKNERQAAIIRAGISAEEAKVRYDKLVKIDPLKKDDWVLLRRENGFKFQSKWIGPFKVLKASQSGVYQLSYPNGQVKQDWVHRDRLKRAVVTEQNNTGRLWTDDELFELDPIFGQEGNDSAGVAQDRDPN